MIRQTHTNNDGWESRDCNTQGNTNPKRFDQLLDEAKGGDEISIHSLWLEFGFDYRSGRFAETGRGLDPEDLTDLGDGGDGGEVGQ